MSMLSVTVRSDVRYSGVGGNANLDKIELQLRWPVALLPLELVKPNANDKQGRCDESGMDGGDGW